MDIVLRAIIVFCFLLVLTRIIGRRELSSLQPFDLILIIILGDAVQQGLTQDDYSLTGAFLAIGTIAGMMVITAAISVPFALSGGQFLRLQRSLRVASGLISLAFGLVVAYQIGIVQGLFGAHPNWTPR